MGIEAANIEAPCATAVSYTHLYDISVSADGYLTEYFYDVPVFEGITSLQPVSLKPDVGAVNIEYDNPINERSFNNL